MNLMHELFGGAERSKVLAHLFENCERDFGPRDVAKATGVDAGNASRLLRRWVATGLLQKTTVSGRPRYRVASDPSLPHLVAFCVHQSTTVQQLKQRVHELGEDIQVAALFGSTASGRTHSTSDIDVLLLTTMSRLESQSLFKGLSRELGRPINVLAYTQQKWLEQVREADLFAMAILESPLVDLKGDLRSSCGKGELERSHSASSKPRGTHELE